MTLDDRIYCLQQSALPKDLSEKVAKADSLFLQDHDGEASALVSEVEAECKSRGIEIHKPAFGFGGV